MDKPASDHPPCDAMIRLRLGTIEQDWPVRLPEGIVGSKLVRLAERTKPHYLRILWQALCQTSMSPKISRLPTSIAAPIAPTKTKPILSSGVSYRLQKSRSSLSQISSLSASERFSHARRFAIMSDSDSIVAARWQKESYRKHIKRP
jgi:hypothetical protein